MVFRFLLAPLLLLAHELTVAQAAAEHIPNRIDSLITGEQVLEYIRKLDFYGRISFNPEGDLYTGLRNYAAIADSFGAKPFEKVDLDNNGTIDLLFNGYNNQSNVSKPFTLVILNFGKDHLGRDSTLKRIFPDETFFDFFAAKAVRIDGQNFLHAFQITKKSPEYWSAKKKTYYRVDIVERRSDTLACLNNMFFERAPATKHQIKQIIFSYTGGLEGGLFNLKIVNDSLRLEKELPVIASDMGPMEIGIYQSRLDPVGQDKLNFILHHLDFPHLKIDYQVRGRDAPRGVLEIIYDNGRRKLISDYGLSGHYGLSELENYLTSIPGSRSWEHISDGPFKLFKEIHP